MKKVLLMKGILYLFCLLNANAQTPVGNAYLGIGTTGMVAGYRYFANDSFAVRSDVSRFSYSKSFNSGYVKYDGDLKMLNFGLYADYFPFANGFFLSAGALMGKNEVKALAKPSIAGKIKLNGREYAYTQNEFIEAKAEFPKVRPYLGLGYAKKNNTGFGFNVNLGVSYGKLDVKIRNSDNLNKIVGFQKDLEREKIELESHLDRLKVYPVLNLGVSYSF